VICCCYDLDLVFEVVVCVYIECGFDGMSMGDLVDVVGLLKFLFYYYVEFKE